MENNWNIPNLLSLARVLMTPAYAALFVAHRYEAALVLFVIAVFTDALDGTLARLLHQRTRLGAILDPLADKALLVTSYVCLAVRDWIPGWLAVIVVSRDLLIVGGLSLLNFWGVEVKEKIQPTLVSKFNTTVQMLLIFQVLLDKSYGMDHAYLTTVFVNLVAASTVASGGHYVLRGLRMLPPGGFVKRDRG